MAKTIKIPKGATRLMFENGHGFILSDKQIWDALSDYIFKQTDQQTISYPLSTSQVTNEKIYDDENPDSIKMSSVED